MKKGRINILVKYVDWRKLRDITNLIKEEIENQPLLETEFKLFDIFYEKEIKEER